MSDSTIEAAGKMWGAPAKDYDDISFSVSDALMHAAMRLNAQANDRVLDIATGTGMSARFAARSGAKVIGIDISDDLLGAARELSSHIVPSIEFLNSDAGKLPFEDEAFDRAVSTFGIMFAPDQECAAKELARVLRPNGRAVIASWAPDPAVGRVFALLSEFGEPAPEDLADPTTWGIVDGVNRLLSPFFELRFEEGISFGYFDDVEQMWDFYVRTFGPLRQLSKMLDEVRLAELREKFTEEHRQFETKAGLRIPRPYLLAIGTRS
jgi:ubiquinone/menaquinone biosynthesis C-methylase UbiE